MNKRANEAQYAGETPPMDQVRDILFGAQMKDLDARFLRQEERFMREVADARDALKTRLDTLENFTKNENAALLNRIKEESAERENAVRAEQKERLEAAKNEQRERTDALAALSKELTGAVESFERKLAKVAGTLDTAEQELRRQLLHESNTLAGKVEEKYQEALNVVSRTAAQIRYDMVYRGSLSAMLNEVAVKLSGPWDDAPRPAVSGPNAPEPPRKGKNPEGSGAADA
jgi:DNA repair exonuclease SbcCD ATPase subunit